MELVNHAPKPMKASKWRPLYRMKEGRMDGHKDGRTEGRKEGR
jgi:hypothetical protein